MFLLQTSIKIWDLESKSVVDDLRPEFSKTYGRKAIEPYCVSLAWSADGGTLFAGEFSTLGMESGLEMWVWGGVRCGGHILVGMERRRCHAVRWWVLAGVAGAFSWAVVWGGGSVITYIVHCSGLAAASVGAWLHL